MTNVSAGNKRSWEGSDFNESVKRQRGRDDPRDWRDVHLKSPRHKPSSRRESPRRRRSKDRNFHRRDSDYRPSRDYSRDRSRRERDYSRRRDDSRRKEERTAGRRSQSPLPRTNGTYHVSRHDEEREEGEISPANSPSPPAKDTSPRSTSVSDRSIKKDVPTRQEQHQPPPDLELEIPPSPPPVEDLIAARRAKRWAILAKYADREGSTTSASSLIRNSVELPPDSPIAKSNLSQVKDIPGPTISDIPGGTESKRASLSRSPEPDVFSLAKAHKDDIPSSEPAANGEVEQVLAADYDPSLDRREDEQKRIRDGFPNTRSRQPEEEEEEVEEEVEEEELDDMFAIAMGIGEKKPKKVKRVLKKKATGPVLITTTTLDSAADSEGYYSVILGEQLDGGRYQVFSSLGKGMFANVVRARILQGDPTEVGKEVAIKVIRCQESMHRAGQKEIQILNKIRQADPDDKKHVVRLERTFEHRGHLCLVFESLSMNLRDVVKRFGKDVGLNIRAVRAYAHQLFLALTLLRKLNVIHADIKPDNILVNEQKTLVKLCDLGSASDASENEITPYLVSRFYRAPEIILGVPYDAALDIWSIGCTLYELYTGKILFPGRSNNQMLFLMMELKGRFNNKMIKKAKFGDVYFDEMGVFQSVENDRVTGAEVLKKVHVSKPTRDLKARLMPPASAKIKEDESKMILNFVDLLDKCLTLDPSRRIQPREALNHPFIRG